MNKKIITFSWDDADILDRKYIKLFDKIGIKCTFNVNSQNLGVLDGKFKADEIAKVYAGHEVAAHTLTHPNLTCENDAEVIRQVEQDRLNLQNIMGYPIYGMAYPGGGVNYDSRVIDLISKNTAIRYARTAKSTLNFDLPVNFLEWSPTAHILKDDLNALADRFFNEKTDKTQVFFIWGHSYELEPDGLYKKFEQFCEGIAGRHNVDYVTNGVIYDLAMRKLI